ncbi:hypothetical protein L7F22_061125 [Adiantum nelumboides]|nr:hypothetical protein [Adiantum nelumboides]
MALHSWWCLFPASRHTNVLQDLNEGSSSLSHSVVVSSFFNKGENAKGRGFQNFYRTNSRRGANTDTLSECAEAQAENLGEACTMRRALIAGALTAGLPSCACIHFDCLPPPLQHDFGLGAAYASLMLMPPESLNNRLGSVNSASSRCVFFLLHYEVPGPLLIVLEAPEQG